jgi:N-acyl-D-amino-acid deacylase
MSNRKQTTSAARSAILVAFLFVFFLPGMLRSQEAAPLLDRIIRGGTIYDGSGGTPFVADIGIRGERIVRIGDLQGVSSQETIDARGMAVSPGFINMLSWGTRSLLVDGLAQSDIRQGVTLEVFGEGWSMGPLNATMKRDMATNQGDLRFDVTWTGLMEYLEHMTRKGVSVNVASFVGATTLRVHQVGYENRKATPQELEMMKRLVRQEMAAGALGIGSSLIYAPAFYADTDELIAICREAGKFGGLYISHLRSEGNQLLEAVDELLKISREANIAAEIYHLKAAGKKNWSKLDAVIEKVDQARKSGMKISADMYTYTAGATGLNAAMPPWVQEGGFGRWRDRLRDPVTRSRLLKEMRTESDDWENLLLMSGSPANVLLVGFSNPDLKHLTGRSLGEVAAKRGKSAEEVAMDLVIEDGSRVECVYFLMSEENVQKKVALPWVSFGSDAAALAPAGAFLKSSPHPRAYGCFARLLGKYVREEKALPLKLAIHKLTGLPAENLQLQDRGLLKAGYYGDVVVFDPRVVQDHATFEKPHQYSVGVRDVLVNGQVVLRDGKHTGAKPGQVVRGPGKVQAKPARPAVKVTARALEIHNRGYVLDGHNDLPWAIRNNASSSFERLDIAKPQPSLHTDIERLRKGNVGAQFWSVYVPANRAETRTALRETLEQIELVHAMVKKYPGTFQLALSTKEIRSARANNKIASLIGVEGGHCIEDSIETLRRLYRLGARYMTLTHSDTLAWADSATDEAKHGGLSAFGEEVVREMNRLGMMVDLSHVSPDTMKDALRISKAPIMFSHSSAREVADHPRNVPDDVLRLTAKNGGVVMVNFFSGFVEPESARRMKDMFAVSRRLRKEFPKEEDYQNARKRWRAQHPMLPGTVHDLVDHIDHIVRVAGIDHVGIGSDYDGVSMLPKQLEDVSTYPVITQELLNRGYSEKDIHKIMSGNIMRAFAGAEKTARELGN